MDPDQPAHPRSLIRIHAVGLPTLLQVEKLHKCTGWSASMLVANPLCWFCHEAAQLCLFLGMVQPVQVERVTDIAQFVRAICRSQPSAADGLTDIIVLLYTLIQRYIVYQLTCYISNFLAHCQDSIFFSNTKSTTVPP
jgi:hypothetical protein